MPEEQKNDANTQAASSAVETQKSGDTTTGTDSSADAQKATQAAQQPTIVDVARKAFDESTSQVDGSGEASGVQKLDTTEGAQAAANKEERAAAVSAEKSEQQSKTDEPPFHEHPRWKEQLAKTNEYETKIKEYEPLAQEHQRLLDYCTTNGIDMQQLSDVLHTQALMNRDPAAARAKLKPLWDQLAQYDAEALPADIQAELDKIPSYVAEGEMTQPAADRYQKQLRETARLRAQSKTSEFSRNTTVQQRALDTQATLNGAVSSWVTGKRAADPDYKPGSELWNVSEGYFSRQILAQIPRSPQEAIQYLEKAYNEAKSLLTKRAAPPATRPSLTSTRSSAPARKEPTSIREVVAQEAAKHGIAYSPSAA